MSGTIGVLSLQGGYREHGAHLRECGIDPVYVNGPDQLKNCVGLIIPGGESSCLRKLMRGFGMDEAIVIEEKLFGSCFATEDQIEGMKAFLEKRKVEKFVNR